MKKRGLAELFDQQPIPGAAAAFFDRLLSFLRRDAGKQAGGTVVHWISDAFPYGINTADITRLVRDFKDVAYELYAREKSPESAARLQLATDRACDHLMQRGVEEYQRLQESEMRSLRQRFEHDREELERLHDQLETIIESTAVGLATLDPDGVYTHWSPSCERLLGYPADKVVGQLTPVDLAAYPYDLWEELRECRQEGQLAREHMMLASDGQPRVIQESFVPMTDDAGKHVGFTTCLVDMTDKRQREEDLRRERNKLNRLVEAMEAGLALFDADMRLEWANQTLKDWFGIRTVKGQSCREVYRCQARHGEFCPVHRVLGEGGGRSVVIERTHDDGAWRCYLHRVTEVRFGRTQYLVLTSDISRQKRQREQMQLIDRLTRALQGSLDLDRVLHLTLVCVTAGHALGFNRAFILLLDEEGTMLRGGRAVGPTSLKEARRIWSGLSREGTSLDQLLDSEPAAGDAELTRAVRSLKVPMDAPDSVVGEVLSSRSPVVVHHASEDPRVNRDLAEELELEEFVVVPLVAHDEPLGVMIADNKYTGQAIDGAGAEQLCMFAGEAALAISNARAYQKIQEQIQELKLAQNRVVESERLASVGRMSAHLAHEMRTPLALIGGYARSIEREAEKASRIWKNARTIYQEEQRLEEAVNEMLEFSRPVEAETAPEALTPLIAQTVEEFQIEFADNNIELALDLAEDLPPVEMDRDMIRQVLINLLSNAVEAVSQRDRPRIELKTRRANDHALLVVTDNGSGMDERTRRNVFAPFFTTKKDGVGLGMAISRRIVQEHDGQISVSSERGQGTAMRVSLPLAPKD
jgi:hypothetical protein